MVSSTGSKGKKQKEAKGNKNDKSVLFFFKPDSTIGKALSPQQETTGCGQKEKRASKRKNKSQYVSITEDATEANDTVEGQSVIGEVPNTIRSSVAATPNNNTDETKLNKKFFVARAAKVPKTGFGTSWRQSAASISLSPNLIVERLSSWFLPYFIVGDQIFEINGVSVFRRSDVESKINALLNKKDSTTIDISVVRAWNYQCATPSQLSAAKPNESFSYFVVSLPRKGYNDQDKKDLVLSRAAKKTKLLVREVKLKTSASYGLLVRDRILEIEGFVNVKPGKVDAKEASRFLSNALRKNGSVKIFIERPIGIQSSPNPSVSAELFSTICSSSTRRQTDFLDPPIDADAVEISLRELARMRVSKNPKFYNPSPSLLRATESADPKLPSQKGKPARETPAVNFNEKCSKAVFIESDLPDTVDLKKVDGTSGRSSFLMKWLSSDK